MLRQTAMRSMPPAVKRNWTSRLGYCSERSWGVHPRADRAWDQASASAP